MTIEDRISDIVNERFKKFYNDYKNAHSSTILNISTEYVSNDSSTMFFEEDNLKNAWYFHIRKIGMKITYVVKLGESDPTNIYISDPCSSEYPTLIEIKYEDAIKILALGYVA